MKNGLGEDITEGKISYPIVYCFSTFRGIKASFTAFPSQNELKHGGLYDLVEKRPNLADSKKFKKQISLKVENEEEDLIDFVNNSNVYSMSNVEEEIQEGRGDEMNEDINALVDILKEKTKDKKKISKAIQILNSNISIFVYYLSIITSFKHLFVIFCILLFSLTVYFYS